MDVRYLYVDDAVTEAGEGRCECCHELLENVDPVYGGGYCYVCDGDECKADQIRLNFRGEHLEIGRYVSYVEMGEPTWEHLYE